MAGLYGSPDTGNLYSSVKEKKIKPEGFKPQKNIWMWIVIGIVDLLFFLMTTKHLSDIAALTMVDSMVVFGVSFVSLFANLFKRCKIGYDVKWILASIVILFVSSLIFDALVV